jgi:hypothetical protein
MRIDTPDRITESQYLRALQYHVAERRMPATEVSGSISVSILTDATPCSASCGPTPTNRGEEVVIPRFFPANPNREEREIIARLIRPLAAFLLILSWGLATPYWVTDAAAAGFPLNFQSPFQSWGVGSSVGACTYAHCGTSLGNGDPTPMAEDVATINSVNCFHVIVGTEPPRVLRRLFCLSQAAMADSSCWR